MPTKIGAPASEKAALSQRHQDNGRERERVADIQRSRILAAMAESAAEHGAAHVTVAHVVQRAGVSRRTFYELFADRDACFLTTFDDAVRRVSDDVVPAFQSDGTWRERTRAALGAFLRFLDEEPSMGRLLVVETLAAGPRSLERRTRLVSRLIAAIETGANEPKALAGATRLTAEGVAGAVLSVIHGRMLQARDGRLVDLLNPLMSMIVLPYLGPAAARRELERPVRPAPTRGEPAHGNPLKDLHMRLTYRTVRVLLAIAAHPGSSNRVIADAAEINDQGQISKLLARLHRLGLIETAAVGSTRGEPNAWTLTERGWRLHAAVAEQAAHG